MGDHLRIIDKIRADYTKHADAFNDIRESKETIDTAVLARHMREADELVGRARKIAERPLKHKSRPKVNRIFFGVTRKIQKWRRHTFERRLKDLHYYALRRRAW